MKVVELSKAKQGIGSWAKSVKTQPVLITRKGKPWMILTDASIYDWEDIGYMTDPKFWEMIEKSRRGTSSMSMAEVRRKYGLPAKPKRARASAVRRPTAHKAGKPRQRLSDAELEAVMRTTWELRPRRARLVGDRAKAK